MKRRNILRLKLYTMIVAVVVILSLVAIVVSSYFYSATLSNRYHTISTSVSETTVGLMKNQDFEAYLEGHETVEYTEIKDKISTLKHAVPDIEHIGVYKMESEGMRTLIDASSDKVKGGLGTLEIYDNTWRKYKSDLLLGKSIEGAHILSNSGMVTMQCTPITKMQDDSFVYVCIGVSDGLIESDKNEFTDNNKKIIGALAFVIVLFSLLFVETRVVRPIRRLYGFVNQAVERRDVDFIKEIMNGKIKTKNELENLYHTLVKIYTSKARLESVAASSDIKDVNTAISLIKRMDKFAQSHLDNSLQYIILLVRKMKEMDKFKNVLTDKRCEDLLLAAPLHDIGKLAVPDEIVNKPARLTDEEFEYMKKHSILGSKIIEEMYLKYSDDSYLHLAREISLSHHERWDGSGYPNHVKGEDIPLEVRIVSIADVFDALVSERVYKPPYSFEEAMEIITSYRGTFFDPDVVDVFINSKDEVYEVYKSVSGKKNK